MKHILKCAKCEKYTMKLECCGAKTAPNHPAKYSPEDPYGTYRRIAKQENSK